MAAYRNDLNDIGDGSHRHDVDWMTELRNASDFVKNYWAILSTGVLAMSVLAMHWYLREEAIPLSIISPDVVASLPVLFILITYIVVTLASSMALPSIILLHRNEAIGGSLIDYINRQAKDDASPRYSRLMLYWCIGLVTSSALVVSLIYYEPFMANWLPALRIVILMVIAVALFFMSSALIMRLMLPGNWKQYVRAQIGMFAVCATMQTVVVFAMIYIAESQTQPKFVVVLGIMTVGTVLLSIFQMVAAKLLWDGSRRPDVLIRVGGIVAFAMFFVCTQPGASHLLVGYVLGGSSTGGRGCVAFAWTNNADVLPDLRSKDDPLRSVDLRVPMSTNDILFARPWQGDSIGDIALIPRVSVAKVMRCGSNRTAPIAATEALRPERSPNPS